MKILLIAATEAEIAPLTEYIAHNGTVVDEGLYDIGGAAISVCITGVGVVATTYALTRKLRNSYDIVIQAGVGGAFHSDIGLGDVVIVETEQFADLGAEDHDDFINIFELGLIAKDVPPFSGTYLKMADNRWLQGLALKKVRGVTVSTVSGNEKTIGRIRKAFDADVESMEGAAFHYVCLCEGVPFIQIRAISNYVEPRDKSKWQMGKAINNLNEVLKTFIDSLQ